jgi:subtilisin-like proprotein convertase family protein
MMTQEDLACAATSLQTVVPFQAFAFNGENSRDWTFRIRDAYETDAGMLNSASINICTKNYTLVEPNFELTNFVLYPNPKENSSVY